MRVEAVLQEVESLPAVQSSRDSLWDLGVSFGVWGFLLFFQSVLGVVTAAWVL